MRRFITATIACILMLAVSGIAANAATAGTKSSYSGKTKWKIAEISSKGYHPGEGCAGTKERPKTLPAVDYGDNGPCVAFLQRSLNYWYHLINDEKSGAPDWDKNSSTYLKMKSLKAQLVKQKIRPAGVDGRYGPATLKLLTFVRTKVLPALNSKNIDRLSYVGNDAWVFLVCGGRINDKPQQFKVGCSNGAPFTADSGSISALIALTWPS